MSRWLRAFVLGAALCGPLEARNRQERAKSPPLSGELSFGHRCCDVERVDARQLSRARFAQLESEQKPFILEHALDHWPAMEWTLPVLQERFGHTKLKFTVQGLFQQIPAADTLGTFLSMMPKSSHDKALYSLTENLAYANGETMEDIGEVWWKHFDLFDEDWFQWFPPALRPTDRAFIFAGKGGFSGLHVDSYNWTGASFQRSPRLLWLTSAPSMRATTTVLDGWTRRLERSAFGRELLAFLAADRGSRVDAPSEDRKARQHFCQLYVPGEHIPLPSGS